MASTTSTEQSGLFAHLLPAFRKATGIEVRVVAVGTGQALDMGRRGDADVVFVHDRAAEEKFVAEGHGLKRADVMYNDFVLVGPAADPAGAKGTRHRRRAAPDRRLEGAVRLARRQERHARRRAALLEGRRRRGARRPRRRLPRMRLRHGPGAEHGGVDRRLRARRPRHLAELQEPRQPRRARRGRQAPVQPVRRDRRRPGAASAREGAGRRRPSPTGWSRPPGSRRSPPTGSAASRCSSPTPGAGAKP